MFKPSDEKTIGEKTKRRKDLRGKAILGGNPRGRRPAKKRPAEKRSSTGVPAHEIIRCQSLTGVNVIPPPHKKILLVWGAELIFRWEQ